jgi:hypothetical protein
MTMWHSVKRWFGGARTGAGDLAQGASIRLDVRGLEGRRNHLLRSIGTRALELQREGRGMPEFEAICREIADVDQAILQKHAALGRRKDRPPEAGAPAG